MTKEDFFVQDPDFKHPMNMEGIVQQGVPLHPHEDVDIAPFMEPQHTWIKTLVKCLGSGTVTFVVSTESKFYKPGEGIQVVVDIINQSPCSVTLKYILYRKQSRISPGRRITGVFPIVRKKAKPLRPHSKGTVRDVITIPRGIPPTISMGSPVELQYILKICLGMTGSSSTYLSMPIVVLPTSLHSIKQHQKLLKALTLGDTLYPNPNQQIRSGGNPPRKPRSMDTPMNY
ncbi:uncharacterized protein LOC109514160 isoform X1 [Hippocampus comes]|uniref:uncharacterized protein LOC109514160 isoform X1 n=1 Tax=Hippocampus comes TaxID=109280 RepID=UPI00094EBEEE|nr:PREDICTED: uncharacterized protein LOC109514160 isoform X1 [Hippocampus comes]